VPTLPIIRPLNNRPFLRSSEPSFLTCTPVHIRRTVNIQQKRIHLLVVHWHFVAILLTHTTLELVASVSAVVKYSVDMSGILKSYHYSGVGGALVCVLIDGGTLIVLAAYGGRACVIIHTLDRYWKIVHPIHHRKYYRPWMVKVGLALPWLLGFAVKSVPAIATTRMYDGICTPRAWPSDYMFKVCCYRLKQQVCSCTIYSLTPFDILNICVQHRLWHTPSRKTGVGN